LARFSQETQGVPPLPDQPLLIGTRGSPLALWQARHVWARLLEAAHLGEGAIGLSVITTSGDRIKDKPLRDFGGKGLFTKEIDDALLSGDVDMAVHSMKDLETDLPARLCIAAILPRGDVRDAFISTKAPFAELPPGSSSALSFRRQAQIMRLRPIFVSSIFAAMSRPAQEVAGGAGRRTRSRCGLERLGLASHATSILSTEEMLPAVAQGAIGVTCREDDARTRALLAPLNDAASATTVACERGFLARLDGSCKTPIAGLAEIEQGILRFRGMILNPDGSEWYGIELTGAAENAPSIGADAGEELLARAGPDFIAKLA
jgi:hydroxymethylbilane synthase